MTQGVNSLASVLLLLISVARCWQLCTWARYA